MTQPGQPIGGQSGTIGLAGVQLEVGPVASPLEKPDPRYDLANCQRFYQVSRGVLWALGPGTIGMTIVVPTMRASPTVTITSDNSVNVTGASASAVQGSIIRVVGSAAAASAVIDLNFTASADL